MKFVAAYLLAYLGADQSAAAAAAAAEWAVEEGVVATAAPTKEDVRRILGAVGSEVEEDRLDLLFAQLEGKDVAELLTAGREQLSYAPSGAAAAVAGFGAPAAAAAAAEAKEEEKEDEVEEEDNNLFSLFDED